MGERKLWISFSVYIGFSRLIQRRRKFYFPRVRSLNANDMRFHRVVAARPPSEEEEELHRKDESYQSRFPAYPFSPRACLRVGGTFYAAG